MENTAFTIALHDETRGYDISPEREPPSVPSAISNHVEGSVKDRAQDTPSLVNVERYVRGEILDLGGLEQCSAHVRLPDGQTLTVRTNKELIRAEPKNLVYQEVQLRITAKLNPGTGELTDASLIEFVHYAPYVDEDALANLVRKGRNAWSDVGDPAAWVRQMRGDA